MSDIRPGDSPDGFAHPAAADTAFSGQIGLSFAGSVPFAAGEHDVSGELRGGPADRTVTYPIRTLIFGGCAPAQVFGPAVVEPSAWPVPSLLARPAAPVELGQDEHMDGHCLLPTVRAEGNRQIPPGPLDYRVEQAAVFAGAVTACRAAGVETSDVPAIADRVQIPIPAVLVPGNGAPSFGSISHSAAPSASGPGSGVGSTVRAITHPRRTITDRRARYPAGGI